jgi:hypothetical protein
MVNRVASQALAMARPNTECRWRDELCTSRRSAPSKTRSSARCVCEAPVLAGVAETAARDVEAANFGRDSGDDENGGKRGQDRQSSEIKTLRDHSRVDTNLMIA